MEFGCFSSVGYAVKQANKFCSQANGNKKLCESLKFEGNVCGFTKDTSNECLPLGYGIETFIRIPYNDCKSLDEKVCRTRESCDWTFKDSIQMKFGDLIKTWP